MAELEDQRCLQALARDPELSNSVRWFVTSDDLARLVFEKTGIAITRRTVGKYQHEIGVKPGYGIRPSAPTVPVDAAGNLPEILERARSPHSRKILETLVRRWRALHYDVATGKSNIILRAPIKGTPQSIIYADPNAYAAQIDFDLLSRRGVRRDALRLFQTRLCQAGLFEADVFMNQSRPYLRFEEVVESSIIALIEEADHFVKCANLGTQQ